MCVVVAGFRSIVEITPPALLRSLLRAGVYICGVIRSAAITRPIQYIGGVEIDCESQIAYNHY